MKFIINTGVKLNLPNMLMRKISLRNKVVLLTNLIGCLCAFMLAGCEDHLDTLTMSELLTEANTHYKNGNYEDAVRFYDKFEIRFPVNSEVPDCIYKRGMAMFLNGDYNQAIAVFEAILDRYPMHERKIEIQKNIFYCYYNQVTSYERDYEILEKSFEYAEIYKDLIYEDKDFEKAYENLNKFMAFYYLSMIHDSIFRSPKHWINTMWLSTEMIRRLPRHQDTGEAYYRVIEFLCAQKSAGARKDAYKIFKKMAEYHADSNWYALAQKCLDFANEIIEPVSADADDEQNDEEQEIANEENSANEQADDEIRSPVNVD